MKNKFSLDSIANLGLLLSLPWIILSGCGGGGGGGSAGDTSKTDASAAQAATGYDAVKPGANDWVMYKENITKQSNNPPLVMPPSYWIRTYEGVLQDGRYGFVDTSEVLGTFSYTHLVDPVSGVLTKFVANGLTECTFSPGVHAVINTGAGIERFMGKYSTSTTWDQTTRSTCIDQTSPNGRGSTFTSKGSIPVIESVTAGGVQYLAAKETYEITNVFDLQIGVLANKVTFTCWRDTVLGRNVKCDTAQYTKTDKTNSNFTLETTISSELVGYQLQGVGTKLPPASQFGGQYKLTYETGTCDSIHINSTGAISGTCAITSVPNISGQVQSDGTLSFTTAGSASFTGSMQSPLTGIGSYTLPGGAHGTWTLRHF